MKYRMAAVLLALTGMLVSAYLYLFKLGVIGTLACGTGDCERVQFSRWSHLGGIEVSLIGLLGYTAIFGMGLVSLQPRWARARWPIRVLLTLAGGGVAVSAWLTGVELFILHAICRWCVGSATIITLTFVATLLAWRTAPPPDTASPG